MNEKQSDLDIKTSHRKVKGHQKQGHEGFLVPSYSSKGNMTLKADFNKIPLFLCLGYLTLLQQYSYFNFGKKTSQRIVITIHDALIFRQLFYIPFMLTSPQNNIFVIKHFIFGLLLLPLYVFCKIFIMLGFTTHLMIIASIHGLVFH